MEGGLGKETFQLSENAAILYEEQKVPAMFGPLAAATLDVVGLRGDDRMLDVACGTGILARTARQRFGKAPRIAGADLNEGMVSIARTLNDVHSRGCDWHVADVTKMPFSNEEFSVIYCQQGLQFFPDEAAALREMRRLLCPGGRLVLTIWNGASDLFKAMDAAVSRHVSPEIGKRFLAPFSYAGHDSLPGLLQATGFAQVTRRELMIDRVLKNPGSALLKEISGHPAGAAVMDQGDAVLQAVAADILRDVAPYRVGDDLVVPQRANLFQATAG